MATVFDKASVKLVTNYPYAAVPFTRMKVEPIHLAEDGSGCIFPDGQKLPTLYGGTDGRTLWVCFENFNKLPMAKATGFLLHEMEHILRGHHFRIGHRSIDLWRQATDYIINNSLLDEGHELPDGGLHDQQYFGMAEEEVYNQLPPPPQGGDCSTSGNGQHSGDPFEGDLFPSPDQSREAVEEWKDMVQQAATVAKARGNLPSWLKAWIGELFEPQLDWREVLREWLSEVCANDYAWARPNRRFVYNDLYLPGLYGQDALGSVAFVLDTSGSMSNDELKVCMGEAIGIVREVTPRSVVNIYCDTAIQRVDEFESPTEAEVRDSMVRYGCGGTDMTLALDHIEEHYPDVAGVVVFTDGGTPFGHERTYPVLWAITEKGVEAPVGQTVHFDVPSTGERA